MQKDFRSFFEKFWSWNILIDIGLFVLAALILIKFLSLEGTEEIELLHLGVLIFVAAHTIFLIVHAFRRAIKKYWLTAFLTLLHAVFLGYICFLLTLTYMLIAM